MERCHISFLPRKLKHSIFCLMPISLLAKYKIFDQRSKWDLQYCTTTTPLGTRGANSITLIIDMTLCEAELYNRRKFVKVCQDFC